MNSQKLISIIIICHNEQDNIIPGYQALRTVIKKHSSYRYEMIYVDNGSTDKTKKRVKQLCDRDPGVQGIILSRDFGPQASIEAGLDNAIGDAVIPYEGDLQDPPELISKFIRKWEQGYDMVVGIRVKTEESLFMSKIRQIFYRVFRTTANIDIPINAGLFSLIDKKALLALRQMPEKYRFIRGLRAWIGFKTAYIKYRRRARQRGRSSYNLWRYIKSAERGIFGFSYLPLDLMVYSGFVLVILSFIFIVVYLTLFLLFGNPIKGSVTILVAIVFFGGIQLTGMSILGKYIQVIVEESKRRPIYIVDEIIKKPR